MYRKTLRKLEIQKSRCVFPHGGKTVCTPLPNRPKSSEARCGPNPDENSSDVCAMRILVVALE